MSSDELPSSVIDGENKLISIPMGPITLHLNFDEWEPFVEMIMDIHSVFHNSTITNHHQCEVCGHVDKIVDYVEPEDTELN
jgi:hypothetical protein